MKLETIIGLEIHAQVNSSSKFFCSCDNLAFVAKANTNICPICMGFPGQIPVINSKVVHKGIKASLGLGCTVNQISVFERKQYFYPDLPTGYQITQFETPLSENGKLEIISEYGVKKTIRINRLHLENDAGKLTHTKDGTLCDYNRAGCPLMEIVSEPDVRNAKEAKIYAESVQAILRYVGSSDCDMEKGMMRFDASVSLRPVDESDREAYRDIAFDHPDYGLLMPRAEIKNLNSFRALEAAINYEIKKQTKLWEKGTPIPTPHTVGWVDDLAKTKILREKESSADYRYFPEPDLPPLSISAESISDMQKRLPELPAEKMHRYISELKLSHADALYLVADVDLAYFFEIMTQKSKEAKSSAKFLLSVVQKTIKDLNIKISDLKCSASQVAEILIAMKENKISSSSGKKVFFIIATTGDNVNEVIEREGLAQVSDTSYISDAVNLVISSNPEVISDYKNGKDKALAFLVGQVMKASKGKANPKMVTDMFKEAINK